MIPRASHLIERIAEMARKEEFDLDFTECCDAIREFLDVAESSGASDCMKSLGVCFHDGELVFEWYIGHENISLSCNLEQDKGNYSSWDRLSDDEIDEDLSPTFADRLRELLYQASQKVRTELRERYGQTPSESAFVVMGADAGSVDVAIEESACAHPDSAALQRALYWHHRGLEPGLNTPQLCLTWGLFDAWLRHAHDPGRWGCPEVERECEYCGSLQYTDDSNVCVGCDGLLQDEGFISYADGQTPTRELLEQYALDSVMHERFRCVQYAIRYK